MGEEDEEKASTSGSSNNTSSITAMGAAVPTPSSAGQAILLQAAQEAVGNTGGISHSCKMGNTEECVHGYLDEPLESPNTDTLHYWAYESFQISP